MGMAADLFLGVGIKGLSEFSSDMDKMHGKVKEFGDQAEETKGKGGGLFDMMGGGVGKALGLATGIGTLLGVGGGLVGMFKDGIDQSNQWNDQMAQLDAVMKSTGGSAGVTKDQVTGLASSLSAANGLSKYADDAVLSGENLLLTFTNIGGNVFPAATQAMLDMSTKMGGDASSSAIQLGKALNDPEKGLTALVKVGVSFTQQQKDQIKAMQDAGNMAGAQQVILKELGNEFGGSAAASAKTFTGIMTTVSEKFHNVTQSIGDAAMPLLTRFADFLGSDAFMGTLQGIADMLVNGITAGINFFSDAITNVTPIIQQMLPIVQGLGGIIGGALLTGFQFLKDNGAALAIVLGTILVPAFIAWGVAAGAAAVSTMVALAPIVAVVGLIAAAAFGLTQAWQNNFLGIQQAVAPLMPILSMIGGVVGAFFSNIQHGMPVMSALGGLFSNLGTIVGGALPVIVSMLGQFAQKFIDWIGPMIPPFLAQLGQWAGALLSWLGSVIPQIAGQLLQWAGAFIGWIAPMIPPVLEALGGMLVSLGTWIIGTALPAIVTQLVQWGGAFIAWVGPQIPPLLQKLGELASSLFTWLTGTALPTIVTKLGEWGGAFIAWVGPQILPLLGALAGMLLSLGTWLLGTALPAIVGKLAEWGGAFIAWVGPQIPPLLLKLGDLLGQLGTWVTTTALPAIVTKLGEWGKAFLDWIGTSVIPFLGTKLGDIWTAITTWVTKTAGDIVGKVKEIGSGIINGIKQGIEDAWNGLVSYLSSKVKDALPQFLKDWLGIKSPSTVMAEQVGAPVVAGIQMGMDGKWAGLKMAGQTQMEQVMTSMLTQASKGTIGQGMVDTMLGGFNNAFPALVQSAMGSLTQLLNAMWGLATDRMAQIAQMTAVANAGGYSGGAGNDAPLGGYAPGAGANGGGGGGGGMRSGGAMATGGIVTGPTYALIGEGGEPEAVVPLSRLSQMIHGGIGSSAPQSVQVVVHNYMPDGVGGWTRVTDAGLQTQTQVLQARSSMRQRTA